MQLTDNIFRDVITNLCDGVRLIDNNKKVTFWNKGAEIITGFKSDAIIGEKCTKSLKIMRDENDLNFCENTCGTDKSHCTTPGEEKAFVRHKDGFLVPVIMCVYPVHDDNGNIVGTAEMFHDISWKEAALERIEELNQMTMLDPLTGVGNRRYAEILLTSKLEELRRFDLPFAISYIDIDDFKKVNDTHGHNNGDELLKIIARTLSGSLRSYDNICRMGGDEFMIIMSNIQSAEILKTLANRFLTLVENSSLHADDEEINATISVGCTLAQKGESMESLIERGDKLMYISKNTGKNRLSIK